MFQLGSSHVALAVLSPSEAARQGTWKGQGEPLPHSDADIPCPYKGIQGSPGRSTAGERPLTEQVNSNVHLEAHDKSSFGLCKPMAACRSLLQRCIVSSRMWHPCPRTFGS